jgi:tungstate transport system substrate-binding protein
MVIKKIIIITAILAIIILSGVYVGLFRNGVNVLRLATTTSVENSGLLGYIVEIYETDMKVNVEYTAVGTGQALELGRSGDVDLLLVHAPDLEIAFVDEGYGTQRYSLMYNDFIVLGPAADPAGVLGEDEIVASLINIAETESAFVSRGDNSGTHFLEMKLWALTGIEPDPESEWYASVGQGMGASLNMANEKEAYILTDRGTYLSQKDNLPNLIVVFGGNEIAENPDANLYNYYSMIPIDQDLYSHVEYKEAMNFIEWITSVEIQELIGQFGFEKNGIPLFIPNSEVWLAENK